MGEDFALGDATCRALEGQFQDLSSAFLLEMHTTKPSRNQNKDTQLNGQCMRILQPTHCVAAV